MEVLVTCKNEEDPIKNEGARVLISLYIDFSDGQGQLTPQSVAKIRTYLSLRIVLVTCKNEDPIKMKAQEFLPFLSL